MKPTAVSRVDWNFFLYMCHSGSAKRNLFSSSQCSKSRIFSSRDRAREMHLLNSDSSKDRLPRVSLSQASSVPQILTEAAGMDHLDALEAQSIYIFREAFARLKKLALLWSLGKDSNVMI